MARNDDYYVSKIEGLGRIVTGCRQHGYVLSALMAFGGHRTHETVLDFARSVDSDYRDAKAAYDKWIAGYGPSTVLEGRMNSIFRKYGLGEE